jgi:hypothetical protein
MICHRSMHRGRPLGWSMLAAAAFAASATAQSSSGNARAGIPGSIREEHTEIHDELARATKLAGPTGTVARELAAVLGPHFEREEQIALPPLGLLAPLARGELGAPPAWLLPMTDSLRRELPQMLREHESIRAATKRLALEARSSGHAGIEHFAEKLALHARTEEEVLYPAAVVVGELVRVRVRQR